MTLYKNRKRFAKRKSLQALHLSQFLVPESGIRTHLAMRSDCREGSVASEKRLREEVRAGAALCRKAGP
jgi:hypothetical protein